MKEKEQAMPILFVPHGGGPLPLLGDENHSELSAFLKSVAQQVPAPKAIILISAHWEEKKVSINNSTGSNLLYDYQGFPQQAYELNYPAPRSPELVPILEDLFSARGIDYQLNDIRGHDHGVFVPLMLMFPEANIPIVQLSLLASLDPDEHIAIGEAISPLREQGVLIVGSGMSFHNMKAFFSGASEVVSRSAEFDTWLNETLCNTTLTQTQRIEQIIDWQNVPQARYSHPREEHLLPLMVCLGAAKGREAQNVFRGTLFNSWISGFSWA